jgi:DNA-binding HxlR family transcriptional regulator
MFQAPFEAHCSSSPYSPLKKNISDKSHLTIALYLPDNLATKRFQPFKEAIKKVLAKNLKRKKKISVKERDPNWQTLNHGML